ncbi:MAG TPA: protoporphyrinogen oxidase [Pyrinomonadaceae bacterium]|jgi:oxygen-dependent protoporphyrinogen oxidase
MMKERAQHNPKRVAIIGGGISGLSAAHRLLELSRTEHRGIEILLLEAGTHTGGVVRTERREGFLLEGGPDSFISEKREAVKLSERLNLTSRLIETNPAYRRSFIVRRGRLLPVPEGFHLLAPSRFWPFVTTNIFSWQGKARMALDLVLPRRGGANGVDDESLAQFVRRRLGREALERMAQPMVGGIYTADPEQLSLRATMPRFLEMERNARSLIRAMWKQRRREAAAQSKGTSGARYSLFLSFDNGMQTLTDELARRLPPSSIKLQSRVLKLSVDEASKEWKIQTENENFAADAVCVALPAYVASTLLRDIDAGLADELQAIPYASTATVNLAYRRRDITHALDGFGFVVPIVEKRSTLACTFSSIKFDGRAPEDCALLRAFVGGALQPEMFELDEEAMVKAVRRDLRDLLGIEQAPLFAQVAKWPRSMAQYHLGHIERVGRIKRHLLSTRTLKLAGNAYEGAGIPDCIRSGEAAADELFNALSSID